MARRIFQILRGTLANKPTNLNPGEFYLDTTNDNLYLQGKSTQLRLAKYSEVLLATGGTVTGPVVFGASEEDNVDVTIHGNLHLGTSSSETRRLVFGDGTNVYIEEPEDDYLTLKATNGITFDSVVLSFVNMDELSSNPLPVSQGGTGKNTALTAADVGARPSTWVPPASDISGLSNASVGYATSAGSANSATTANSANSAASATKLTTARTIQTNLDSTSAASFNGTANVTPGITGTLAISHGGTGITDSAPMRKRTGTLSTTWSGSSGNFTQNVSISGMTASVIPIVIPQISNDAQQTAWNCLKPRVNSYNGGITFYATTKPTTAVSFTVIWNI